MPQGARTNNFARGPLGGSYGPAGRGGPTYDRTFSKIDAHIHSFYPQSSALWNRLPPELRTSEDLDTFSKSIKNINLMALNTPSYAKVAKM